MEERGWRKHFQREMAKLHDLPGVGDHFSAHRPTGDLFKVAQEIVDVISREDMPLPLVTAGSDGSIELTWRRNPSRELSCFIEPGTLMVLLVRDGKVYEEGFDEPNQINRFVNGLFD